MRIAIFQGPERSADVARNLEAIGDAVARAAAAGADLVVTSELAVTGYDIGELVGERAEAADGPIARHVADLARRHAVAVAYGYPERAGDLVHNTVQVLGREGEVLASYRKTHLFGELDRGHFAPGDDCVVQFRLDDLTCGVVICYDIEFPEMARAHADAGTDLLVVPTGLMAPFDVVARILVPARAYESQLYVAYANHCGREGELDYTGLSCVVGPDGADLARAGRGEELLLADVGRDVLDASRAINTHLRDRRPDLYRTQPIDPRGSRR